MIEILVYPVIGAVGLLGLYLLADRVIIPAIERSSAALFLVVFGAIWGLFVAILKLVLK